MWKAKYKAQKLHQIKSFSKYWSEFSFREPRFLFDNEDYRKLTHKKRTFNHFCLISDHIPIGIMHTVAFQLVHNNCFKITLSSMRIPFRGWVFRPNLSKRVAISLFCLSFQLLGVQENLQIKQGIPLSLQFHNHSWTVFLRHYTRRSGELKPRLSTTMRRVGAFKTK